MSESELAAARLSRLISLACMDAKNYGNASGAWCQVWPGDKFSRSSAGGIYRRSSYYEFEQRYSSPVFAAWCKACLDSLEVQCIVDEIERMTVNHKPGSVPGIHENWDRLAAKWRKYGLEINTATLIPNDESRTDRAEVGPLAEALPARCCAASC